MRRGCSALVGEAGPPVIPGAGLNSPPLSRTSLTLSVILEMPRSGAQSAPGYWPHLALVEVVLEGGRSAGRVCFPTRLENAEALDVDGDGRLGRLLFRTDAELQVAELSWGGKAHGANVVGGAGALGAGRHGRHWPLANRATISGAAVAEEVA